MLLITIPVLVADRKNTLVKLLGIHDTSASRVSVIVRNFREKYLSPYHWLKVHLLLPGTLLLSTRQHLLCDKQPLPRPYSVHILLRHVLSIGQFTQIL